MVVGKKLKINDKKKLHRLIRKCNGKWGKLMYMMVETM